jgi:outer membrane autotransporter protein/filamentous hemagglutinin family protein
MQIERYNAHSPIDPPGSMRRSLSGWRRMVLPLACTAWVGVANAQDITIDGTLSPAKTLTGPNYVIDAALGQTVGGNLFQSFGQFGLNGGSASFLGPPSVTNILSRVTGGDQSVIDGLIQSSIAGSNSYFINPSGITLAPSVVFNLSGSFHAATADYIALLDGAKFSASNPASGTLSPAPVSTFGFVSGTPQPLFLSGPALSVAAGSVLDFAGGKVSLFEALLTAPSGAIFLTGVGSAGEVSVSGSGTSTISAHGPVEILESSVLRVGNPAGPTGSVGIRASTLKIDLSTIDADNFAGGPAGAISVSVDDQITMSRGATITAQAHAAGPGADVTVQTGATGSITIDSGTVQIGTSGSGNAGRLAISTGALVVTNGATLGSVTTGSGNGGIASINATSLTVANGATVAATATGSGAAGLLSINVTGGISLQNGSILNATVAGAISSTGGTLGDIGGTASLTSVSGTTTLQGRNSYSGGTSVTDGALRLQSGASLLPGSPLTVNGGTFDLGNNSQTLGALSGTGGTISLGSGSLTTNSASNTLLATTVVGTGSLVKQGSGTLALAGANTYSGGTTVSGGVISFSAGNNFGTGPIFLNGGGLQWAAGNTTDISSKLAPLGTGGAILDTNGNNITLATGLSGQGGLTQQGGGVLTLTGASSYSGPTTVAGGTLAVNGSLTSPVTLNAGSVLTGNGSVGGLVSNGGLLVPGSGIGTLTVNGNLSQNGGVYQVETNAAGQGDRINIGGTATIAGGATVQVLAQPGTYAPKTTYTILTAAGGISGAYSGVSSNFAFLAPSLSYDTNDVFLTLQLAGFAAAAQTPNQYAVGSTLDRAVTTANGDFATVLSTLIGLNNVQGPAALTAISGTNYSGLSSSMVQTAQLFMSNFSQQAGSGSGNPRVSLAQTCDVACDAAEPALWGAWGGALGGLGVIGAGQGTGAVTYNLGGFAAGLDRVLQPNFRAGVTVGYAGGTQWVSGFNGQSMSNAVFAALYGNYNLGKIYVDGLAGYGYSANQMWRNINIPGLNARTAQGITGANEVYGLIEGGYRVDLGGAPDAYVTPFMQWQGFTATQNAFSESGAQSLDLSVASQTTSSVRSILGAQLGGTMDMGWKDKLSAQLRLGWSHEYADTARPVTASFAGAPAIPFTTFGVSPQRDGVVLGLVANTAIAEATSVYLRYEGDISGQDNSHALTVGVRMTW